MADLVGIAAQAASSAFGQAFDPHGRKKADVDLRKQQIEQAKLETELKKMEAKQAKMVQALTASKFDPETVEKSVNQLGLGFEVQFDKAGFNASKGVKPQVDITSPGGLQALEGAPAPPKQGEGEYTFRIGTYDRDPKGNILMNDDGTRKFTQDAKRMVTFANKQDMVDTIGQLTGNPAIAMKQALAKIDIDVATAKGEVTKEVQKHKGIADIATAGVKTAGAIAVEKERAKRPVKKGTQAKDTSISLDRLSGKSVKLNYNEQQSLDKDREVTGRRVAEAIDPDFDPGKKSHADMFNRQEMFIINETKKSKAFKSKLDKAKADIKSGKAEREDVLRKLAQKLPQKYAEFLLSGIEETVKEKKKAPGIAGFFGMKQ